ncbi:MAG TPA: glycolate oxidase subunit GlcF [Terriglobales bacterium]|nr:glycolate oxidase subunit GlcF [Terriglobales bacterium]
MQTHFSLAQLTDPNIAEADKILRNCVHCGFCTATCPTYLLRGDELDSPRGRIYLIKDMLESNAPASETVTTHVDRCLSCLSCMTTCPSGVHYMHLVDYARQRIEETYQRPFMDRMLRKVLANLLPSPGLFRTALRLGQLAKAVGIGHFMRGRLKAMVDLIPSHLPPAAETDRPGVFPAIGQKRGRVALLAGCAQQVLRPAINAATIRLLNRLGIEVVVAPEAGCCGSLTHHMGLETAAHEAARGNIAAWHHEYSAHGLDAIIITASGCGTTVKDYGFMFRGDLVWRERAELISSLACDISQYLDRLQIAATAPQKLKVAYHAACSLQHGQKLKDLPAKLLRQVGFEVVDIPEGHICCGSAGTYNMLQPELSMSLRDRKAANIAKVTPQVVASGNIGCLQQLAPAIGVPIVHTVELLDWALGGPVPGELTRH